MIIGWTGCTAAAYSGKVNEAGPYAVQYIPAFNAKVRADERITISLSPMTDGVTLARKP